MSPIVVDTLRKLIDNCGPPTQLSPGIELNSGESRMKNRRTLRLMLLGIGLGGAMAASTDMPVGAQGRGRHEDAVVKLAGKKLRIDRATGKLGDISVEEARALVATLTEMTTRTDGPTVQGSAAAKVVQMDGFDHVLVARPNENGTSDVRCVSSVDEAAEFLGQPVASSEKE
jgi:hypothetical protein